MQLKHVFIKRLKVQTLRSTNVCQNYSVKSRIHPPKSVNCITLLQVAYVHRLTTELIKLSFIIGPSFLEGGPIMYRCCPSVCPSVRLSVCLSVPCLHLEGKRKGLRIPNLVGRIPGTRAPRGPISKSKSQRPRSRWLIALLAKNPPPPKHGHHVASSSLNDSRDGSTCCRRVVARTYSTARTAPQRAAPQRLHTLVNNATRDCCVSSEGRANVRHLAQVRQRSKVKT